MKDTENYNKRIKGCFSLPETIGACDPDGCAVGETFPPSVPCPDSVKINKLMNILI